MSRTQVSQNNHTVCMWAQGATRNDFCIRVQITKGVLHIACTDGHILVCGGSSHWTKLPQCILWLLKIFRPAAARAASAAGADPATAMSLVNIDTYSVHRSLAFRSYFRTAQDDEDGSDLSNNLIEFIPSC
jgi:hypothetical protein